MSRKSTERFSDRVESFIRYRPGYPAEVVPHLQSHCGLDASHVIADIGSGTGISTRLFLENGNNVFAVEPNADMRQAAESTLAELAGFNSINATAEATGLDDESVDMIVAGQAFHWFDRDACRREFKRILRPGGWLVLIWNERLTDTTPFLIGYEELLNSGSIDYKAVNHANITDDVIDVFYAPNFCDCHVFPNAQLFDYDGLRGRCLSSSYVPQEDDPLYDAFFGKLKLLFDLTQEDGLVSFDYATKVYSGHL